MRLPSRPQTESEVSPPPIANEAGGTEAFAISADLLIPGRGEPTKHATVVVKDGVIAWAGPTADLPAQHSGLETTSVPVAMPGLWDAHTHFMGADVALDAFGGSGAEFLPGAAALIGAVTVADLHATLMAGFTSVRELGGYAGFVAPAVARGAIVGPNVYSAIGVLSITGGHGDAHDAPLATVRDACLRGGSPYAVCDGPDECVRTVRRMVRQGARVIKVCSTGGVLSRDDQPEDTQFSPAELRAIVAEAARSGRVVAAHAIGKPGIVAALEAGVRSVEHGMYLDDEVATLMKAKGAILCPTRHIAESLGADPEKLPLRQREKMLRMLALSRSSLRLAVRRGVKIALGTDTYSSDRRNICSHGTNAKELFWAVEAGMTPLQAVEMGTATPPETLGPQAPLSGQIREGYDADIIAVAENPLDDIVVLTKPANITHVWKGGKLFKEPAK